jgi:hypothetical protein
MLLLLRPARHVKGGHAALVAASLRPPLHEPRHPASAHGVPCVSTLRRSGPVPLYDAHGAFACMDSVQAFPPQSGDSTASAHPL